MPFMRSEILFPNCHYKRLENGINQFIFLSNTRAAVDDYFSILESSPLAQGAPLSDVVCVLIELRETGMPPVTYMMMRYRAFVKAHKNYLPVVRVVYLYHTGFVVSLVQALIDLVAERKHANRRFFHINERAEAEAWLLEERLPQK